MKRPMISSASMQAWGTASYGRPEYDRFLARMALEKQRPGGLYERVDRYPVLLRESACN